MRQSIAGYFLELATMTEATKFKAGEWSYIVWPWPAMLCWAKCKQSAEVCFGFVMHLVCYIFPYKCGVLRYLALPCAVYASRSGPHGNPLKLVHSMQHIKVLTSNTTMLEIRVHTHLTIRNHADYHPSAARTNCVASFRFTSELEVHLPTEVTSVSK